MADINVVRKRPSAWPWVFGLVILVLVIWGIVAVLARSRGDSAPAAPDSVLTAPGR